MKHLGLNILMILAFLLHTACGKNLLATVEKEDVAEDATIALEKNNPDQAISNLKEALEDDPDNYQLISLLSAATAQKYGIDALSMALEMASSQTGEGNQSGTEGSNSITALFAVVPEASKTNIDGINEAISIMMSIPAASRTKADNFYLSLMSTAALALQTKKFDKDGDGLISPVELLDLSDDDAVGIIESLLNAESALANGILEESGNSKASAEQISQIRTQIDAQEGATTADKLRNYLNKDKAPT